MKVSIGSTAALSTAGGAGQRPTVRFRHRPSLVGWRRDSRTRRRHGRCTSNGGGLRDASDFQGVGRGPGAPARSAKSAAQRPGESRWALSTVTGPPAAVSPLHSPDVPSQMARPMQPGDQEGEPEPKHLATIRQVAAHCRASRRGVLGAGSARLSRRQIDVHVFGRSGVARSGHLACPSHRADPPWSERTKPTPAGRVTKGEDRGEARARPGAAVDRR